MRHKDSCRALVQTYRRYARSVGWNDHQKIAEQKVDLWLRQAVDSVDAAIQWNSKIERQKIMKAKLFLCVICTVVSLALFAAYAFAVGCEQQVPDFLSLRELCREAFGSETRYAVLALHVGLLCFIGLLLTEAVALAGSLLSSKSTDVRYDLRQRMTSGARFEADPAEPWAWDRLR